MKTKGFLIAFLSCMFALTLGLVACGGGDAVSQSKAAFTGDWTLSGMEADGNVTSAQDLEQLKSLGLEVTLSLKEDGSASLSLFGESVNGTWEPKTATEASMTAENQTISMTIAEDTLTMEQSNTKLSFVKSEAKS